MSTFNAKTRLAVILAATAAFVALVVPAAAGSGPELGAGRAIKVGAASCNLIATRLPLAAPAGTGVCPGVRPGGLIETHLGFCTLNFLFHGSDGHRYIGTAGHCMLPKDGEASWPPRAATELEVRNAADERIGDFAYAVLGGERDFALIRLDPGVEASPEMCHFGGPTSINDTTTGQVSTLNFYGQGLGVSEALPARSLVAPGMPSREHVFANGVSMLGDSGSGVLSADGGAVGVLVAVGAYAAIGGGSGEAGTVAITRLRPQLDQASAHLRVGFTLQTASLL